MKKIVVKIRNYVNQGGIFIPKYVSKTYTTDGYKLYENISYKIAKLDRTAILLFHFICEEMDQSNNIVHTRALRKNFISHANKNMSIQVKDETVKKAFNKLVKVGLVINYDIRSDFTVNPRHVFKGAEKQRQSLLNTLLHSMKGQTITKSNYRSALGFD